MLYILNIVGLSFLIRNSLILVFKRGRISNFNKGIGITFLSYSLVFLSFLISFNLGLILKFPILLRITSPLFFLIPPIFYLTIRNIGKDSKMNWKIDFIHFLPPIIHFLDLLPLYILSNQEKSEIIEMYYPDVFAFIINVQGLIPTLWVNLAYLMCLIFYFILALRLVYRFPIELKIELKQEKFKNILFSTLVFYFVANIIFILSSISIVQFYFIGLDLEVFRRMLLICSFLIIYSFNFYFFYNMELSPALQKPGGLHHDQKETMGSVSLINEPRSPSDWSDTGLDREDVESRINQLMEHEKVFLDEGLLLNDFAKKAKIPVRVLPDVLNLMFQKTFKELILERRVGYAKKEIELGYLDKFTLESLRSECGFGSRTAFFYAFKKESGLSPNEYWKEFQRNSNSSE